MTILYLSRLNNDVSVGPCWSIPASVKAQSLIDDVIWINEYDVELPHWIETGVYHKLSEYSKHLDERLLESIGHLDFVVFENFYNISHVKFATLLKKNGIPYIIVPRGAMTKQSLYNHSFFNSIKKKLARFFIFKPYAQGAHAIQYLTESEKKDSGYSWCDNSFIIPNGFDKPSEVKEHFSEDSIKSVFIGRPSIYHKGLDLLIEACKLINNELRASKFTLDIYAPQKNDYSMLSQLVDQKEIKDFVFLHGEIRGGEKKRILLSSDLFVMTSRFEGHPMGLVEAISFGVPVLVTPGTNMYKEVIESDSGWGAQCEVESIATTLLDIINNRCELSLKSENALRLSSNYSWNKLAVDFHNELIKSLKKRNELFI